MPESYSTPRVSTRHTNPALERWQRSNIQRATANEEYPFEGFDAEVARRLDDIPDTRDAVHIVLSQRWFHSPAVDGARRIGALLEDAQFWERELLAGRIVSGEVKAAMLR